jgi:hypothetical protein
MPDDNLPQRTLKTTFWLAAFLTLIFYLRGQTAISFGLAIGAAIGLTSLGSLTFAVPRLFNPGNPVAKLWLGMIALVKLPVYALVLSFAMSCKYIAPLAVFVGAALVPAVIVLKVLGNQLLERINAPVGEEACRSTASN